MGNFPAKKLLWPLLFWGFVLGGLWLAGCRPGTPGRVRQAPFREQEYLLPSPVEQVSIYYLTRDERYFVPVTLKIGPTRGAPRVAVEKLLAGAPQESLASPFPPDVKLLSLKVEKGAATLDLTGEVMKIKSREAARRAFEALVLTLTEFREVKAVKVLVNGNRLPELAGYRLGGPLTRPALLNPLAPRGAGRPATIYYADSWGLHLIPITLFLPDFLPDRSAFLARVVRRLVAGPPAGSGLTPPIAPGTRVLRVEEENGIVTVDLSSEALAYGGGSTAELAFVNALVFTLTEFPGVEGVQLLFEGEKRLFLPEGTEVAHPLRRPPQLNPVVL